MPTYRAFVVGPDGGILRFHNFEAPDRFEAKKRALALVDDNDVELWEGDELLARMKPRPPKRR